jgi:hypothetical protein
MKADAVYGISKEFGNIMRLTYEDGSKVYLSKYGLTITLPKSKFKKEWNKKKKDFGFTFNKVEIELLMKALNKCDSQWRKFKKKKKKSTYF